MEVEKERRSEQVPENVDIHTKLMDVADALQSEVKVLWTGITR